MARPVDSSLRGSRRQSKRRRYLFDGEVKVKVHEQRLAVSLPQAGESSLDVEVLYVGFAWLRGILLGLDSGEPKPAGAPDVPALVGHDGEEPGPHRRPGSELVKLAPGSDHGLLSGILRFAAVAQDAVGKPEPGFDQRPREGLEGGFIARHRPVTQSAF